MLAERRDLGNRFFEPIRVAEYVPHEDDATGHAEGYISVFGRVPSSSRQLTTCERAFRAAETEQLRDATLSAKQIARRILERVAEADTPKPTFSADDDGGVSLYWRAGKHIVHIDVTPHHQFFVRVKEPDVADNEWYEGAFPIAAVRQALSSYAAHVKSIARV